MVKWLLIVSPVLYLSHNTLNKVKFQVAIVRVKSKSLEKEKKAKQKNKLSPDQYWVDFDTNNTAVKFRKCKCKFCASQKNNTKEEKRFISVCSCSFPSNNEIKCSSARKNGVSTNKRKLFSSVSISPCNPFQSVFTSLLVWLGCGKFFAFWETADCCGIKNSYPGVNGYLWKWPQAANMGRWMNVERGI